MIEESRKIQKQMPKSRFSDLSERPKECTTDERITRAKFNCKLQCNTGFDLVTMKYNSNEIEKRQTVSLFSINFMFF
jgi:hypothetical protein